MSSVRKRDAIAGPPPMSAFSFSTAVISTRRAALPTANSNSRRSSASATADPSTWAACSIPANTSISSWVRSTPPRTAVLGHKPSCTPGIATTSHSRPTAACALTMATASGSSRVVRWPTNANDRMWSIRPVTPMPGVRATCSEARSNNDDTASRSRSACAPNGPPRCDKPSQRRCKPDRVHAAHSTSRTLAPDAVASRAAPITARTRRRGAAWMSVSTARCVSSASTRTARSSSALPLSPPAASSARSNCRRNRLSATGSTRPSGPVASVTASSCVTPP
ncbi:Uncharacterised protein [Mycobacteroides abscessus subsp. abscessus]|nr:Uncharacterised protein [Mycobacteroides abscessus subsp. abscessus]